MNQPGSIRDVKILVSTDTLKNLISAYRSRGTHTGDEEVELRELEAAIKRAEAVRYAR